MSLKINNITKVYNKKKALNNFTAEMTNGVYGLLGPNGAGKTTIINIIVGITQQNSGAVEYNGTDIRSLGTEYLDKIGYLPQNPRFYKNFKAEEFLMYMCALKGINKVKSRERVCELLKMVNLWEERNKKIGSYSGGMKQRIGIAQAMLNDPAVLILDEPTAGLDPKERIRLRNLISKLSSKRIVLLATHIVADIEYIAKQVILLKAGNVIKIDKPVNLINSIDRRVWKVEVEESEINAYMDKYNISNIIQRGNIYELRIVNETPPKSTSVNMLPNLEDVFLYYFEESEH